MWRRDAFSGQEYIEFLALFYLHVSCTNASNANCLRITVKMSSLRRYDVLRLRKTGRGIATSETDAFDTLTGTTRRVPVYRCDGV